MKTEPTTVDRAETIQDIKDDLQLTLGFVEYIENNIEYMVDDFQLGLVGIAVRDLVRITRVLSIDVKHGCNRVTMPPKV